MLSDCRPLRWLQLRLSSQASAQLCTAGAGEQAASILYVAHTPAELPGAINSAAHITTSSSLHLQLLLSALNLDHAFYVQLGEQPAVSSEAASDASTALWLRSMAWAVQAHIRAGQPCRCVKPQVDFGHIHCC